MSTATDSESETDSEDYPSPASNTCGPQTTEASDRTQTMNFDSDIEWLEATHTPATGNIQLDTSIPTGNSSDSTTRENMNVDSEENQQPRQPADASVGVTTEVPEDSQGIAANLPYLITSETIKALRYYAECVGWMDVVDGLTFRMPLNDSHSEKKDVSGSGFQHSCVASEV